jgi:hypothetical protein
MSFYDGHSANQVKNKSKIKFDGKNCIMKSSTLEILALVIIIMPFVIINIVLIAMQLSCI